MSNFLRKFRKEKEPNWKELYEIELNNRKKYEKRYREKCKDYIDLQKEKGLDKLKLELMKISDDLTKAQEELSFVKEDRAKLYIQLEDTRNELKTERNKKK